MTDVEIPEINMSEVTVCVKMIADFLEEKKVSTLTGLAAMSCILAEANDKLGIEIGVDVIKLNLDCAHPESEGEKVWN